MIPNLLATAIGLWLSYAAIFPGGAAAGGDGPIALAAVAIIALALWARRTDAAPWQSTTSIVTASLLVLFIAAHQFLWISATLSFWCILWAGLIPATVSLWSALYRPVTAR